jgi:hypothetical protein
MVETGFSVVERSGDLTGKGCVLYSRRLDYQSMMGELGVDLCMENWVPVRISGVADAMASACRRSG